MSAKKYKVVTLCSGYDSQLMSLERLKEYAPDKFDYECVAWSEIDDVAINAHNACFPELAGKNLGDMTCIDWNKVEDFDILTYSTPCTDVSSAGQQKGIEKGSGTRSAILWFTEEAIKTKRPPYLLMENVKALVSKKFMPYFQGWLKLLESYGYKNFWQVLDATNYGVAQHRERVFVVSILDKNARYEFPQPYELNKNIEDYLEEKVDDKFFLDQSRVDGLLRGVIDDREDKIIIKENYVTAIYQEIDGKKGFVGSYVEGDSRGSTRITLDTMYETEKDAIKATCEYIRKENIQKPV